MGAGASGAVPPKTGGGSSSSSSSSNSNNNNRYNLTARAGSHPLGSAKAGGGTGIDDGLLRSNKNDTTGNKVFLYIIGFFCQTNNAMRMTNCHFFKTLSGRKSSSGGDQRRAFLPSLWQQAALASAAALLLQRGLGL